MALRLGWFLVAQLGLQFARTDGRFHHGPVGTVGYMFTPNQALDMWVRWDGFFYLTIAQDGYGTALDNLRAAFFPLYPLLCRLVRWLVPVGAVGAALGVSNICDIAALVALFQLCRLRLGSAGAWRAILLFAAFPTRNFGFSAYTEGLFLWLSVGAFGAYERRRWGLCALCCALVSASRPQGICVGAALGLDALVALYRARHLPARARRYGGVLAAMCAPAGLCAYMIFLQRRFAAPLAFAQLQGVWKRRLSWPGATFLSSGEPLNHLCLWAALGLLWAMWRARAPRRDVLYIALSLAVPLASGSITSMPRFVGVLFPLFIFAAAPPHRGHRLYWPLALGFSLLMAFKVGQGARVI